MIRAADEGIFNPAGNDSLTRENKRVGADRDAAWDANGIQTSEPRRDGVDDPFASRCRLQPGGGLDEPGTFSEQEPRHGDVVRVGLGASRPADGSAEPGTLHPVAAAYLAANAGYGARALAWLAEVTR